MTRGEDPGVPLDAPLDAPATYQLIAFDVDGTLVENDKGMVVWQLLNQRFGGEPAENAERFSSYLKGRISYAQWVDMDIEDWRRAEATRGIIAEEIVAHLHLVRGARRALTELARRGYRLAVISGTLDIVLELLFPVHPFEEVFTNKIWFDDEGKIAGWEATPYDMEGKARALRSVAARMQIPLERTVFVGDNINDLQAMAAAGLAVAFEPKAPSVSEAADHVIREDMRGLLEVLDRTNGRSHPGRQE